MGKTAFIVAKDEVFEPVLEPDNIVQLDANYEIWYYEEERLNPLTISEYTYSAIPKCLGLLSEQALEVSGIIRLQEQLTLSLKGQGVFVAIIDTGIQIEDRAFRKEDGSSRIWSLWDQTMDVRSGEDVTITRENPPEGFINGREYSQEDINRSLLQEDYSPGRDEDGHGTLLASIVAGSADEMNDYRGALPESQLIVVKLKPAGKVLRDFYYIPEDKAAFSEVDIMEAVDYVVKIAARQNRPLVILLGLGCNNGSHDGTLPLCAQLDDVGSRRKITVIVAAGNEGNKQIHYSGRTRSLLGYAVAEMNVEKNMKGFYVECWGNSLERFAVAVASPSGELHPKNNPVAGDSRKYYYNYEDTYLEVDYRNTGRSRRNQLIFLRFSNVTAGVWRIYIYSNNLTDGNINMWLPLSSHQLETVSFLSPDPDITITMPSDSAVVTSVGAYRVEDGAPVLESGRGFLPSGNIKPDFVAPGTEVEGKGLRGQYVTGDGTSVAAAVAAGASGQLMEWAVIKRGVVSVNSVDIKNQLIRGCQRRNNIEYPNTLEGYGQLNVYTSFRLL